MNISGQSLTPRLKRYGILSGSAVLLVSLVFITSKRPSTDNTGGVQPDQSVVDFTGVPPKELTLNRISAELEQLHQQQQVLQGQHQKEIEQLQQEILQLSRSKAIDADNRKTSDHILETEPLPPDVLGWNHFNQPAIHQTISEYDETPPQPLKPIRLLGTAFTPTTPKAPADNTPELLRLPAGSLLSGQLITGLDVPTGQGARREPYPVLIRINAAAILPNRYRTQVRDCFVLASGYGDLSSERAYLRSETLSCIFKLPSQEQGKEQVIEKPLEGYLAGEDGKAGLRGRLVSKQGQVMAKAAMAGFLGGVSEAFDIKPVPVFSMVPQNLDGAIQSPFQTRLKGKEALQSSLVKGSNKALEKLADFYLKLADQMVPVIEISAERPVDLILTRGLKP